MYRELKWGNNTCYANKMLNIICYDKRELLWKRNGEIVRNEVVRKVGMGDGKEGSIN